MKASFKQCEKSKLFFNMLPLEWQNIIVPQWENYKDSSIIYILEENKKVIAGGILFSKTPPNASPLELEHDYLFKDSYLYIGYIFVLEEYRNKKLASIWLQELKNKNNTKKFWLTIETYSLKYFYEKNGFKQLSLSCNVITDEWVFISN